MFGVFYWATWDTHCIYRFLLRLWFCGTLACVLVKALTYFTKNLSGTLVPAVSYLPCFSPRGCCWLQSRVIFWAVNHSVQKGMHMPFSHSCRGDQSLWKKGEVNNWEQKLFQLFRHQFPANSSHTPSILIKQFLYLYLDIFVSWWIKSLQFNLDFVFYLTLWICGTTCYPFQWEAVFDLDTSHSYADAEWWTADWMSKSSSRKSFGRRKLSAGLWWVCFVYQEKRRRFWYILVIQNCLSHLIIDVLCNPRSRFVWWGPDCSGTFTPFFSTNM